MRKFIIKASGQITLPVTPESFEVSYGRHTETVSIHEVGDVNLPGGMALGTIKVGCMFPENDYPFALDSGEPYEYVGRIEKIIKRKKPVRFVVSGTGINERVLIEEISYGEPGRHPGTCMRRSPCADTARCRQAGQQRSVRLRFRLSQVRR